MGCKRAWECKQEIPRAKGKRHMQITQMIVCSQIEEGCGRKHRDRAAGNLAPDSCSCVRRVSSIEGKEAWNAHVLWPITKE